MTQIKKVKTSEGVQFYPQTHTKAVIDDNGYSVESRMQAVQDVVNQAQMAIGAVPSDLAPTEDSTHWVTSGGVFNYIMQSGVFDLSAYNSGDTYVDLSAALTAMNSLPAAYKKAGMSIKFVQSSDNKYVQYRYMKVSTADADFRNVVNWENISEEVSDLSEEVSDLSEEVSLLNTQINGEERQTEVDFSTLTEINGQFISDLRYNMKNGKHVFIDRGANDEKIVVTANTISSTRLLFLKEAIPATISHQDSLVPYISSIDTNYHDIGVGETEEINIPSDAIMIMVNTKTSADVDKTPESFVVVSSVRTGGLAEEVSNLSEEVSLDDMILSPVWVYGSINSSNGEIIDDPVNPRIVTSEPLLVNKGSKIILNNSTLYKRGVAFYSTEGVFAFYYAFATSNEDIYVDGDYLIRASIGLQNDGEIQSDEYQSIGSNLIIKRKQYVNTSVERLDDSVELIDKIINSCVLHRAYIGKKEYRMHMDEAYWCLFDLQQITHTEGGNTIPAHSIFEESTFNELKRIHDSYGTCFVLSLHYEAGHGNWQQWIGIVEPSAMTNYKGLGRPWNLSDFPDYWKSEFEANSDWLKFSFHTNDYSKKPTNTDTGEVVVSWNNDMVKMEREVKRFAGQNSWSCLYAKTHGVKGSPELIEVFQRHGSRVFEGDPEHVSATDSNMTTYYLTKIQESQMFEEGSYWDSSNGALFLPGAGNIDRLIGCPSSKIEANAMNVTDYLNGYIKGQNDYPYRSHCDYLSFCIHEDPIYGKLQTISCPNNVTAGDTITINGVTYEASVDFSIGNTPIETLESLYSVIQGVPHKTLRTGTNYIILNISNRAVGTDATMLCTAWSESFQVLSTLSEIEAASIWLNQNGWTPKHFDFDSFLPYTGYILN